jgi:hypothetical protein
LIAPAIRSREGSTAAVAAAFDGSTDILLSPLLANGLKSALIAPMPQRPCRAYG